MSGKSVYAYSEFKKYAYSEFKKYVEQGPGKKHVRELLAAGASSPKLFRAKLSSTVFSPLYQTRRNTVSYQQFNLSLGRIRTCVAVLLDLTL